MTIDNREDLLVLVASLYYEQDYSQQEIADRLEISRSNISRLLKEAKQKGFVEILVRKPISTAPALEREFCERFRLSAAMVVGSKARSEADNLAAAGQLAAHYLKEVLRPNSICAIAWGTGVSSAVSAFPASPVMNVDVVQMLGSVGTVDSVIDGPELARQLALKLGGHYYYMHAPLFVENQTVRDMIIDQPMISDTLRRARRADVALVGIGTTQLGASSFLRAGHLSEAELADLRAQGVAGETCGQHFDIQGGSDYAINRRVISVTLADVKHIPHVIAVACGLKKTRSILGALRGGYVNALATDDVTAAAVLEEANAGR